MLGRILVVDDEKNITFVIHAVLERAGFEVLVFNDPLEAMQVLESEEVDTVITDLYMPGLGGMEILEYCQKHHHLQQLPVVIMTAYATVESAVNALKKGAFDFITKPFDQSELLSVVEKAVATLKQRQKEPIIFFPTLASAGASASPLVSGVGGLAPAAAITSSVASAIASMIGTSPSIQEIYKIIGKIAQSPSTVLVWGESGTGKELVAFEIHRQSHRDQKPFVKINCAAIPATLIESELFGFEKGAFTGAVASKPGKFELAHEGTLFLDEVAEMPLEMQAKLLRILQEQEFERVGGVSSIQVDVRIIAATNKDLEAEVKGGRFREDLFYRLNVVPIHLPPLRARKEDIDLLIKYFLQQFNQKLTKSITGITPETLTALRGHHWPGNIRQLENVLERMMLMAEGTVLTADDLPEEFAALLPMSQAATALQPAASLKQIVRRQTAALERDLIEKALLELGGNVTKTSERLGLSRKGLQLKMKELGLKRE